MTSSISSSSSSWLYDLLKSSTSTSNSSTTSTSSTSSSSGIMSAEDMFAKLTKELGGDGKTITKSQLESYIKTVQSDTTGKYDKGALGFLTQLDNNWNKISGGSDSITSSDLKSGMSYLAPPTSSSTDISKSYSSLSDLYAAIADEVGADDSGISKKDLLDYLDSSSSSSSGNIFSTNQQSETNLLQNLLKNYSSYSDNNTGTITESSLFKALSGSADTISSLTSGNLTSLIDVSV